MEESIEPEKENQVKDEPLAQNESGVDVKENFKDIFNKWGTYQSLQKDVDIVRYFMERVDQKIRQKTVIENFKGAMTPKTCRDHLYKLVNKNVLHEDQSFKGTYFLPSKSKSGSNIYYDHEIILDVNNVIKLILGKSIYDLAFSKLISDHEKEIKVLKKDLENCRNQLTGLR